METKKDQDGLTIGLYKVYSTQIKDDPTNVEYQLVNVINLEVASIWKTLAEARRAAQDLNRHIRNNPRRVYGR